MKKIIGKLSQLSLRLTTAFLSMLVLTASASEPGLRRLEDIMVKKNQDIDMLLQTFLMLFGMVGVTLFYFLILKFFQSRVDSRQKSCQTPDDGSMPK